ncbi:DUF4280 domain-containing protein [Aquimarina aquimarini]|uniref:DUF4280 domain-containing protein n=1 Tax=Aquimarina aquimarini TaxID=1191734 RepID=UPI000D5624EE|nr:DUF4280 domain-containing protein [Aquimarina aquimarini]
MSSKIYVLDGALLQCNQGFVPAKLLVTENQKVKIQGQFKATDMDVQVPATFGQCKLKPTNSGYLPCIPGLQRWTKTTKTSTLGGGKKFLYADSECMCGTGGKVTIMQPMQINTAGSIQEQFKEIAMTIPGAMLGNDKAPKIVETYWMDEEGKERIDEITFDQKAAMFVRTENMNVGERVEVTVEEEEGNAFCNGESTKVFSGTVRADGTVALRLVTIDTNQEVSDNNSGATAQASSSQNDTAVAGETNEKEVLETGVINKGQRINENGKIIVVNSQLQRAYDWIYADTPSNSEMKRNGMTDFDVKNVNLTKSYPTAYLKAEFKSVLWGFSDIEDGFGKNGRDLANHFFTGQGQPFIFGPDSNPVQEVKDSDQFKSKFLPALEQELVDRYKSNKYVTRDVNRPYNFKTRLPYYSALQGMNPNVNEVATFVGGIQGCLANYEIYKQDGEIQATITNLSFFDTFGAGWEDGGADGTMKQWIPGLVAMFCLQHFKNVGDKTKFQPFAIMLNIEL